MRYRTEVLVFVLAGCFLAAGCSPGEAGTEGASAASTQEEAAPHVAAETPVEAGGYLIRVAGCNDCHTAGYLQEQGRVPQDDWLTGSRVGFRGPWGTTYPTNLRRTVQQVSEDRWVEMLKTRDENPPMPWFNVHAMSERDLRASTGSSRHWGHRATPSPTLCRPARRPGRRTTTSPPGAGRLRRLRRG